MEMESSSSGSVESAVRTTTAESRTEGTECSICSVIRPRGMRWGSVGVERDAQAGAMGSMSRSKMAEEEEWTEVGEEGIEEGEREPRRCVRRSWELRLESLRSRAGFTRLVLEVI